MNRLDRAISDVAYILDTLTAYGNIVATGCCNECELKSKCAYAPEWGQMVRYNCPFYERKLEDRPLDDKKFYEFLWNVINPNQMEEYLAMFNSNGEKTDG